MTVVELNDVEELERIWNGSSDDDWCHLWNSLTGPQTTLCGIKMPEAAWRRHRAQQTNGTIWRGETVCVCGTPLCPDCLAIGVPE